MLGGFVGGLIVAWILSLFGVDSMIITSAKEICNITMSISTYYISFALIGLIGGAFHR
jgi:hypothetical protein